MSRNDFHADATPDALWAVISNAELYGDWVVGAKEVRGADASWPSVDSVLHHTSGVGPIEVEDITTVLEADPGNHIKLEARLSDIGTAVIDLSFEPEDGGTKITIEENFVEGIAAKAKGLTDLALKGRNEETLRRLARLAEAKR